ncbi:MAG: hypothetical protein ISQ34_01955 [Rickettsiales bacterium]|nr:hypothetical protein [Rickettsiales bacterium]
MFRTLKLITLFTITLCVVILMVNNREFVVVRTFPLSYKFEVRLFVVMLSFFMCGYLFSKVATLLFTKRSRGPKKKEKKRRHGRR